MHTDQPIAIVGTAAIMPDAPDVDAFWRAILESRELVTEVPASRWLLSDYHDPDPSAPDKTYAKHGAFLPEVEFDPMAFGVPPRALPVTDSAQLLALMTADRLLNGLSETGLGQVDGERVGVFLGSASLQLLGEMAMRAGIPQWRKVMLESGLPETTVDAVCERFAESCPPWQEGTFPGLLSNVIAGRIANRFDLHGANFTVDAACASSLAALSVAVDDLRLGRSDLVITGGVDTMNDPVTFQCFSKTPALSPTGSCRPFDASADGTVLGEGIALFAIKRLADAERDGDHVHSVIRGIGSSSDGNGTSVYAPSDSGQARALRRAYENAGYRPDTVEMVETHGTGTTAGDAAEVTALRAVFDESKRADRQWCALGSVKSQIGHTKAAAGAAGLLKATLSLRHKVLPPTINVEQPDTALDLATSPFYLNTAARPWPRRTEHPRRVSVSSFGFGGSNFHVALEEYVPPAGAGYNARCLARPAELVALSGSSSEALLANCRELIEDLGSANLAAVARSTQQSFRATDDARLCVTASTTANLTKQLEQAIGLIEAQPAAAFSTPHGIQYGIGQHPVGRVAFVFAGQGTQRVGMGADLAMHFPQAQQAWDRFAEHGVSEVVFPPPALSDDDRASQRRTLADTRWAQPSIAAHSMSVLGVLEAVGVRPDCVAGHSFGELIALHAARVLSEDGLMRLARRRGELMRDAAGTPGVMLALEASRERVVDLLARSGVEQAWIANHNAPHQIVVAASADAAVQLEQCAASDGIDLRRLDTAAAFHSPLVAPASEPLRDFLSEQPIGAPLLDVYGNADASVYPIEPGRIRHGVATQLTAPVRFKDMVEAMYADGVRVFVEVGPGSTLSGLIDATLDNRAHRTIAVDRVGQHGVTSALEAVGQLAVLGVPIDFEGLWTAHESPDTARDASRPSMPITLSGANYGRGLPPETENASPDPTPTGFWKPDHATPASVPLGSTAEMPVPDAAAESTTMQALLDAQRETARAHAAYLSMAEKSIDTMLALSELAPHGPSTAPPQESSSGHQPEPAAPTSAPDPPSTPEPVSSTVQVEFGTAAEAPPEPSVVSTSSTDLQSVVISTVSEKTGYPVEILAPHMELEADLGLDSITRTQVLATLRPMFPQLENIDRERISKLLELRTVGDIADQLRQLLAEPDAAAPPPPPAQSDPHLHRHVMTLVEAPATGESMAGLENGRLIVTRDGTGVAEAVVRLLTERGVRADIGVSCSDAADAGGVLFLGGLAEVTCPQDAVAIQREAFGFAQAAATRMREHGGVFITVQDTGGGFGHRNPQPLRSWIGGLPALARTARWEWPRATTKAVDYQRGGRSAEEMAGAIVEELLSGGPAPDVAVTEHGQRWALQVSEVPEIAPTASGLRELGDRPVIVISGGARGIAAASALELARRRSGRFVLIGRSAAEDPAANEVSATLDAIERTGSEVRYASLDVRNERELRAELDRVRAKWGPIAGVVHAAGVLDDERIENKTAEQFDRVFGTKVDGLGALLAATRQDPLALLCAFSSVVGSTGNAGQCDYAMANETLSQVIAVEQDARPDLVARALLWGPWEGGMVTAEMAEVFRLGGIDLIPVEVGARAFASEVEIASSDPRIIVTAGSALARMREASRAGTL